MGQQDYCLPIRTKQYSIHCSSNQHEHISMVWECQEERGREEESTLRVVMKLKVKGNTKTKVATQHRYPPERNYHISGRSVRN